VVDVYMNVVCPIDYETKRSDPVVLNNYKSIYLCTVFKTKYNE